MESITCYKCGKPVEKIKPCPYNRYGFVTCDDCCEECYKTEPFPCKEHDERKKALVVG